VTNDATEPFRPTRHEDPFEDSYDWDYEEERTPSGILWGRVLALAAMLIVAFVLGRASAPSGVPPEEVERLQTRLQVTEDELARAEAEAQQAQQNPSPSPEATEDEEETTDAGEDGDTLVYTVRQGDSFRGLAEEFYNDASLDDFLAEANGMSVADPLQVGQELQIPPEPEE
jgi:nucleoid-associated protein YgaU